MELGYFDLYITVLRNEARSDMDAEWSGCGVPSPPLCIGAGVLFLAILYLVLNDPSYCLVHKVFRNLSQILVRKSSSGGYTL